ncbi:DegV family protein [Haloplasma contractile]|uniref:DegV family protein n=1 Tax=Haloplasma contractile SSD-17B TaxID=1033810 RepID=U2E991_9MOLU|nr:DegV family protein [Haloplasma contractile]ERJ11431.1 DegV family protein [Haloplasma contractile SSD-17B]
MATRKIAILTDSSSSLDYLDYDLDNMYMFRLPIFFGSQEYIDGETINLDEFYHKLETEEDIPTTSQPSLGQVVEMYEQLIKEGYTDIIHFPISKGLSGSYQSAFTAKSMIEDDINIEIVDIKTTAVILGYIVGESARLAKDGKSVEEIIEFATKHVESYNVRFMVEDLTYLVKNGRLSNASAFIGNMLKIKPILEFNNEGNIIGSQKIRTTKKAIKYIVEEMIKASNEQQKVLYFVSYSKDQEIRKKLEVEIESKGINLSQVLFCPLPSVIGAHIGNSLVAFGYFVTE